ncbi:MAG TPA: hypothetical protein VMA53_13680 [Stellaceae bacterium]|nr:hypothetical protein [Stellaceae bacterium]
MMLRCIAAVALGAGLLSGCANPPPTVVYGYAPCAPAAASRPRVQPPPGAAPPAPFERDNSNQCVVPLPPLGYPTAPSPSH